MKFIKTAYAHCDLMCGVYDPAQARIEAQSVLNSVKKYHDSDDDVFKQRAVSIKEARAELVKQHLWVLWTDYFKPEHTTDHPELHQKIWQATKLAGEAKKTMEISKSEELIEAIDEIGKIFESTKEGYSYQAVLDNLS